MAKLAFKYQDTDEKIELGMEGDAKILTSCFLALCVVLCDGKDDDRAEETRNKHQPDNIANDRQDHG